MKIFPAIDVIDGKCVRLSQGDYSLKKIYNEDPLDAAKQFEDAGLEYLHLVDLDGAKAGTVKNWRVVEKICHGTGLSVDFGGGIKTREEIVRLLEAGVKQINLGSIAVKNVRLVSEYVVEFGDKIILSADVVAERVKVSGWQEDSSFTINQLIDRYTGNGLKFVTCTDISKDGMLQGANVSLYHKLVTSYPTLCVIASGGVSSMDDVRALAKTNVYGAIVGKAIYENRVTLQELKEFSDDFE